MVADHICFLSSRVNVCSFMFIVSDFQEQKVCADKLP